MAPVVFQFLKFVTKVGLAGGAVYVAHDQGLLGSSNQGDAALEKAKAAVPPAVQEWTTYFGWELPEAPKLDFSLCDSWNWGVQSSIHALSVAPTRACEYTKDGWKYLQGLVK
ncbi:MICOS complex subunit MIC13 [Ambystoma mexicanum]|uniref:MICOS complex subunit MIC13 n=1 Tax=Ambystoma mexicanum TaxID=8296 RepID=UPI0037E883B2